MMYLYVPDYITYTSSIIDFMLSTSLNHDIFKGPQIPIRWVRFHFLKVSFCINMISMIFSLTIKGLLTETR